MRTGPGGLHRIPIIEIEFDDGVPAGGFALGIGADVILLVVLQAGKILCQRGVDVLQMATELCGT